ncbi:MAG TPA: hypothetical protein VEJ84_10855 [Acidimicrobiales bacterium]|nr:hypothetical protein [Acidimicrobiales bacterium]
MRRNDKPDREPAGRPVDIVEAIRNLEEALVRSGAVTPESLRAAAGMATAGDGAVAPGDLVPQATAARHLGLSRQTVRNWVLQGRLRTWSKDGRDQVSYAEVHRLRHPGRPAVSDPDVRERVQRLAEQLPGPGWEVLRRAPETNRRYWRTELGHCKRILVDLVLGSLGSGAQADLSDAARSLDVLSEWQQNDPADALWHFAESAMLGVEGHVEAESAARLVLGEQWADGLLELCFAAEQVWPLPVRVYTARDVGFRSYSFYRRAAETGPTISYSITPGLIVPSQRFPTGIRGEDLVVKNGLLRSFPGGLSYFQYSEHDTADALVAEAHRTRSDACYETATGYLAEALSKPHLEISAAKHFGWWKQRLTRTSPVEQVLSIRTMSEVLGKPDQIKRAIEIRYDILREAVPDLADPDDVDTWRFVLRVFDFGTVERRYFEERERAEARVLRSVEDAHFGPNDARSAAEAEITRLRHLANR